LDLASEIEAGVSEVGLSASGICFGWSSASQFSLKNFSIELKKGKILGLFGPNGSGKSTLMKILGGLIELDPKVHQGRVRVGEEDFLALPAYRRARQVAYIPPTIQAEFSITAQDAVTLARICQNQGWFFRLRASDQAQVEWAMRECECWDLRDRSLGSLSGGEKQLVALARGLAQGARVLLLDEALSQMDLNHQAAVGKLLRRLALKGYAILLVSHDVNLALELADEAVVIRAGEKIYAGRVQDQETLKKISDLYSDTKLVFGQNPSSGKPHLFFRAIE
jgi:iron complex transport system ATP-binding protein